MNSETPETDAATFWGRDMGNDKGSPHFECVDADFARSLELRCKRLEEALRDLIRLYESKWSDEPSQLITAREALTPPTTI